MRRLLSEPLEVHGVPKREVEERVDELFGLVQLRPEHLDRYPHEFSGGQRQRIGIARALAISPASAGARRAGLRARRVSIQAEIMRLLIDLRQRLGLSYVFIAHDLAVVRQIADRVAVMYLGKIVETGPAEQVYDARSTLHPGAAVGRADPGPGVEQQPTTHRAVRRAAEPDRSAARLPVPHPLLAGRGAVCRRGAVARRRHARTATDHAVACHFPGDLAMHRVVASMGGRV